MPMTISLSKIALRYSAWPRVFGWINLLAGTVLGLALFVAGVRLGGKWLDARGPELLAQVTVHR